MLEKGRKGSSSWVHESCEKYFDRHRQQAEMLKHLEDVFQVTYAKSGPGEEYFYYLLKPREKPTRRFGFLGETLALYSPYPILQAREIDTLMKLRQQNLFRVDPFWNILISASDGVEEELEDIVTGKELEIGIIPFTTSELKSAQYLDIITRIEKYAHGKDLFAFSSPLKMDTFFFGRDKIVSEIIGLVRERQNFGLFGLRKIGKTSVLYAVKRALEEDKGIDVIHMDCQSPDIYSARWYRLIEIIINRMHASFSKPFNQTEATTILKNAVGDRKITVFFDEIETISPEICPMQARHWNEDFLPFWGALRALHQETKGKLTFGIAGVNPHCAELPVIGKQDNPIFQAITPHYLPPLDKESVRKMINKIGRYMGLTFAEDSLEFLEREYYGHPFIVRQACSHLLKQLDTRGERNIDKNHFDHNRDLLDMNLASNFQQVLVVLAYWYPDEYDLLLELATGDQSLVDEYRKVYPDEMKHLYSYGLCCDSYTHTVFTMRSLRRFLQERGDHLRKQVKELKESPKPVEFDSIPDDSEHIEIWAKINKARNRVEPKLRRLVGMILFSNYGLEKARQRILSHLQQQRKKNLQVYGAKELLDEGLLFFNDLKQIVLGDWDAFTHIFVDRDSFISRMDLLNKEGRVDAHAKRIDEVKAKEVLKIYTKLEKQIDQHLI